MKPLYTSLLLLSLLSFASAELPFKKKPQEFQTRVPADVAHTLQQGAPVQRNDLALELGIYAPNPSSGAVKSNAPCVDFSHLDERQVKLRADAENALLIADSSICESTYLVIFDKAPKSEWRHVQTIRLSARTGRPEITYAELIQPGVSEILIYNEATSEGGTLSQQDFVVLKMLRDRVEAVLDATQNSEITLANRSPGDTTNLRQTQMSTFNVMKAPPNSAAQFRVLEKEVITDNQVTLTRYHIWTWDPGLERFRPAPYDGANVMRVPPPLKRPVAPKQDPK